MKETKILNFYTICVSFPSAVPKKHIKPPPFAADDNSATKAFKMTVYDEPVKKLADRKKMFEQQPNMSGNDVCLLFVLML